MRFPRSLLTVLALIVLAPLAPAEPIEDLPPLLLDAKRARDMEDGIFYQAVKAATKDELDNSRDAQGWTALHIAAAKGFQNEVALLLRFGAEPNVRDSEGRTPLHLAVARNDMYGWMSRDYLVVADADIEAVDNRGYTPLMVAAEVGNVRSVELLVWLGASTKTSRTPLEIARTAGETEVVTLLEELASLPPVTLKEQPKEVPLYVQRAFVEAAAMADYEMLEAMLEAGADIDGKDHVGSTALHRAAAHIHEDIVTYLILLGADPNVISKIGNTPFMSCGCWHGLASDWVRGVLVVAGTRTDTVNLKGYTTLTENLRQQNDHGSMWAIYMGADPKAATPNGSPMRVACKAKDQRVIDILRTNGVTEPEWVDPDTLWQLESAAARNQQDLARKLIAQGVDPNVVTKEGYLPLNSAIHSRQIGMARLLLELGADPRRKDANGGDALFMTSNWQYAEVDQLRADLILRGADVNSTDKRGISALMNAAHHGDIKPALTQLVEAGANLELENEKGETALDYAVRSGRTSAAEYLLSMGAKSREERERAKAQFTEIKPIDAEK